MGTWTKQKGYPVLTLTKEKGGTVYKVVQVKNSLELNRQRVFLLGLTISYWLLDLEAKSWHYYSVPSNIKSTLSFDIKQDSVVHESQITLKGTK